MNFRSEKIQLCQLILHKDAAFKCVVELGKKSLVHFKDLNEGVSVFHRTHVAEIRRFTELQRSLRYIEEAVIDAGAVAHIPQMDINDTEMLPRRKLNELESRIFDLEKDVREFLSNESQLKVNYNVAKEFLNVLQKVEAFFQVDIESKAINELGAEESELNEFGTPLTPLIDQHSTPWFISGTIDSIKRFSFERVLWRACRRTAFVRTAGIDELFENPLTGKPVEKCVFIVFFKGEKLHDIVNRVCEGFNATQYNCPKSSRERQMAMADITVRLHDLKTVIETTEDQKMQLVKNAAYELSEGQRQIHLQKTIYHTLNKFTYDTSGNFVIGECWVPEVHMPQVKDALQAGATESGSTVRPIVNVLTTDETPPTFNRVNKFTRVFQTIVDSYGIACYREVNPAPYTIITFPFLFAIMFGDVGHGIVLILAALWFIWNEKKLDAQRIRDEIFHAFFAGRYIILLMGLFSIYTGSVYNDAFSKSFNVFGSAWVNPYNVSTLSSWQSSNTMPQLDPALAYKKSTGPYWFGLDPVWNFSNNRLTFINSMKMKASIIIGIAQMMLGICLSFANFVNQRSFVDILTNFIPQMVFLFSIFVYLCIQIVVKWIYFWVVPETVFGQEYPGSHCAPSLLIGLINMCMFKKRPDRFQNVTIVDGLEQTQELRQCHLAQWYPHQQLVEPVLVILALICIPIMLFGKPLCARICRPKKPKKSGLIRRTQMSVRVQVDTEEIELIPATENKNGKVLETVDEQQETKDHEEDMLIHQAIHTVEFVLGCISHTASYLRLWALSLAHSQLSEVMWHMVLAPAFKHDGVVGTVAIYFAFFVFMLMTVAILVLMEGLSAFLHAIRLHWVEFQSKFYGGTGKPFIPFNMHLALKSFCKESEVY